MQFKKKYNCESGLLFPLSPDCAQPLSFRYIQYNYDLAFQKAGIKFSGTHVLRHGGNRHDLHSHGDITIAQVRLENRSMSATEVYSARDIRALDSFTLKKYDLIKNALPKIRSLRCKSLQRKILKIMLRDIRYLEKIGRGDRIRTYDPLVPNQMRYQTALRPDELQNI